jgi:hypothetical protein
LKRARAALDQRSPLMSEKQGQKDSSACAASSRNDAHDHVGTLRTIMLEKVHMISRIRTQLAFPSL